MADALTSGTGDFDHHRFIEELPKKLGIKERKVKSAIEGLAKDRKRSTLVQSISYLRQRNGDEAVKSLNNLLACHKVSRIHCCFSVPFLAVVVFTWVWPFPTWRS